VSGTSVFDRVVAAGLPVVPPPVIRRFAAPYVAGLTLDDAVRTVTRLRDDGLTATVDVLGEAVGDPAAVERTVAGYSGTLDAMAAAGLTAGLSVKPTALGGQIDWDLCRDAARAVVVAAAAHGRFVRLDMEESAFVTPTLSLYRRLREEGHENVGVVLQARLWRTPADLDGLADLQPDVRLVKGVYAEPPAVAAQDREAVRRQFSGLLRKLLRLGCRAAIATHDEVLVTDALAALDEHGVGPERCEFQMLLGVRYDLACLLARAGYRVRLYVPYGSDVYAYSVRRLKENPDIAGAVARAMLADPAGTIRNLLQRPVTGA
jgi:proline dehydrogenase